MDKDIIDNILSKRPSIAEGAQYILNRYPNKISLDLFLDEFFNETKDRYLDTLLKLTDKDILYYLKFLKERKEVFEIPLITISQPEHEKVKYFIRNVDGYKVISNCYGIGKDPKANFMQVIQLDYIVLEHFGAVDFLFLLSVSSELKQVNFLFSILEKFDLSFINKRVSQRPQQNEISDIENEFDHVDISKVYDYFNKELVQANFLTDTQLKQYLKAAFERKEPPKDRFTFKTDPQKSVITNVFYRYYTEVAARGRRKGYRDECASLLGEYFNGYNTKTVKGNFNK
jgi:hypothetical protein